MASTYENDLRLEEMATGENSGSWGTKTNTNLELIADAFSYGTETIADADTTITIADGAADAARSLALKINSSADLTTTRTITLAPNTTSKVWIIENNTSGGQTLTISAGSGSNITLLNGQTKIIATDGIGAGSNVVELTQDLAIADLFIDDDLSLQSDGGILKIGADADLQVTHSGSAGTITNATGDLTVDVAGDIILDADGGDFKFRDGGAGFFTISNSSLDAVLKVEQSNEDFIIKGNDGGSEITALTLDMSEAGAATFNAGVTLSGDLTVDTDTLYVDSTNNRVGIGDASPSATLNVSNDAGGSNSWTNAGSAIIINEEDTTKPASIKFGPATASQGGQIVWGGVAGDGPFIFRNYNTERVRFDEDGRVLIGTDSTPVNATEGRFQFAGTTKSTASSSVVRYSDNSGPPHFFFGKTRSATIGTVGTSVSSGDTLGYLAWAGDDGTDIGTVAASIDVEVDGTPGTNDMPGRMRFFTTADGSQTPTERMRIDNAGNVGINTTNPSSYTANGNNLVVADVNVGITLASTSTVGSGALYFADGTSGSQAYRGIINYLHSSDAMGFHTGAAQAMTIDSSQRVLIGLTSDLTGTGHKLQLNSDMTIMTFDGTTTGANGIRYIKSRASSPGSNAIVADGDDVGFLDFRADDGTDYATRTAVISSSVDGTPGTNDMPGNLRFYTTADGASAVTERMRIKSTGQVLMGKTESSIGVVGHRFDPDGIAQHVADGDASLYLNRETSSGYIARFYQDGSEVGNIGSYAATNLFVNSSGSVLSLRVGGSDTLTMSGANLYPTSDSGLNLGLSNRHFGNLHLSGGVIFSDAGGSGTSTSNTLDSYEEGTFTPSFQGQGQNPTISYTTATGIYTKVGRIVHASIMLSWTGKSGGSGQLSLVGLPFAGNGATRGVSTIAYNDNGLIGSNGSILIHTNTSSNSIYFMVPDSELQSSTYLQADTGITTGAGHLQIAITYQTS